MADRDPRALTPEDVDKLRQSINRDRRTLRSFRDRRVNLIRDYCGSEYGEDTKVRPTYLNLIHQYGDTLTQVLAANRPRVLINTEFRELKWFATHFQHALNNHIKEIRLEEELRMCVLEAYFCLGVMKVYMGPDAEVKLEGTDQWVDPGRPYAEHISLDYFGFDTQAQSLRKVSYAWDEYFVSKAELLADPRFQEHWDDIRWAKTNGPRHRSETAAEITDQGDHRIEFDPMIRLMDVWLPRHNKVITMIADNGADEDVANAVVIREIDWDGPANGPYHYLSFSDVPDNIIGVSPAMVVKQLNDLINSLYRKSVNQARRARTIPFFAAGGEADAKRLQDASDGEWTRVKSKDSVGSLQLGGVDAANAQFTLQALEMFDRMSGNLPAMAGLGQMADTLGQDQIIQSQIGKKQAKMQERVVEFTVNILRDLGWLLWNDQNREIPYTEEIPGTDMTYYDKWTPEMRQGKFILYNFDLEPYSMSYKSPSQRANALLTYVNQVAMPLLEMFMQQGGSIDLKELTNYFADLNDMDRLKDVVRFQPDQRDDMQPKPEEPPRPSTTSRTHFKNNVNTQPDQMNAAKEQLTQMAAAQSQGNVNVQ